MAAFSMLATLAAMGSQEWSVLEDMSVAQLSSMLHERGHRCVGCIEKEDFLAKLRELDMEMEVTKARPSTTGVTQVLDIKYCMSWGYRKAFEDYARALRREYPDMQFRGDIFHPGGVRMAIAQLLQMSFFGGLIISFVGKGMLPESVQQYMNENQLACFGLLFGCNIMSGQLINTGAFEISLNGQRVWSKIETGRFPQLPELMSELKAAGLQ